MKLDALGDQIIWLSSGMAEAAESARAQADESILLARHDLAPFLESLEVFDEVWPLNVAQFRSRPWYRLQMLLRLRKAGFARVLQMRIAREFLLEDLIVRAVAAPDTRGVLGDTHNLESAEEQISRDWYTPLAEVSAGLIVHELECNRAAAWALSGHEPRRVQIEPRSGAARPTWARNYYVLAPGAGSGQRQWPLENFAATALQLQQWNPEMECVLAGTRSEHELGAFIAERVRARNLCGELAIADLVEVIRHARVVLTNESAPGHVAAYCGVPAVVILGGGHFKWFMPYPPGWKQLRSPHVVFQEMECYGCNWHCRFTRSRTELAPCVRQVGVAEVLEALAAELASGPRVAVADAVRSGQSQGMMRS